MKKSEYFIDPFLSILPKLDLHGETRDMVRYLILDCLKVNLTMKNYKVQIIHGIHGGILKDELYSILKSLPYVERYYLYGMNVGVTIVELKQEKKF